MVYVGFNNEFNCTVQYEKVIGDSIELNNIQGNSEIRVDLTVEKMVEMNIWGYMKDCNHKPLAIQTIKLLQKCYSDDGEYYKVVEETKTDENGYYTLATFGKEEDRYNIIVEADNTYSNDSYTHKAHTYHYNEELPERNKMTIGKVQKFYGTNRYQNHFRSN